MKKSLTFLLLASIEASGLDAAEPAARRPDTDRMVHACAGCHGTNGYSLPPTPRLAGKPQDEFIAAMRGFKSGQRVSSIMNRIAQGYTDDDFLHMAQFFSSR
jgi:sulfide dehydrogenase cytochrome subunit